MKKIFILLFSVLLFTSCVSWMYIDLNARAKELQLGMVKEQVIRIMGNNYKVTSVKDTEEGVETALRFYNEYYYGYVLYFLDDKLVEWHEYIPPQPIHVVKEKVNAN